MKFQSKIISFFLIRGMKTIKILYIASFILFLMFIIYCYSIDHKKHLHKDNIWYELFQKYGINTDIIDKITHDDNVWYYDGISTCVGYGEPTEKCLSFEYVCFRDTQTTSENETFGSYDYQVKQIISAINNGGVHEFCPLLYQGAN